MKQTAKKLLALLLALMMLMPFSSVVAAAGNTSGSSTSSPSISDVSEILNALSYAEYREKYASVGRGEGTVSIDIANNKYVVGDDEQKIDLSYNHIKGDDTTGGVLVPSSGTITWSFNLDKAANYVIEIEYCQTGNNTNSIERIFYINGSVPFAEARSIVLSKVWTYDYKIDENGNKVFQQEELDDGTLGNDIRPNVIQSPRWITYTVSDSNGFYAAPFEFYFQKGENTISLESQREPIVIKAITLRPAEELPTYRDYLDKLAAQGKTPENSKPSAGSSIIIEAEKPDYVSAVTMYPINDRTSPITTGITGTGEQSHLYTLLNTAGKEKWQTVGEWMEYTITPTESGFYSLAVRYKQALLSGMYVSRRVYINGEVLFDEANNCRFPYADDWATIYLNDGSEKPFEFYLEANKTYTIRLEASLGEMAEVVQEVSTALANINACYLEILKLTGSTPDANRNYGFARVMPDVLNTMMLESIRLKGVYDKLVAESGKGEKTSTIEQVYLLLEKMARDENEIAANLGSLKSHIGSLGTWINSVKTQPLQVDKYVLQNGNEELPEADAGFFASLWFEIKLFFASFVTDYSAIGNTDGEGGEDRIQVWVVTGRDQAQIIRNLINNEFTPNYDIHVDLKLVSGGTLLPSVLAGVGPDVSLMESSTMIIDYALRNAVIPLNQFISTQENPADNVQLTEEEKENSILSAFPDAAMVPLTLYDYRSSTGKTDEIIYGLPDSLTFSMMFYRKDVLASLGEEVPKTWDDLLSILPVLQYNHMEIGIQNDIYMFIYQNGLSPYKNGGMNINFDDPAVLNAFTTLCNMYTQYSLPYQFDFANRFRTGEMPIGIAAYTTCNQLEIFASELSGLWSFVPLPGVKNADGTINNTSIATVTGCVMLDGCPEARQENAWSFMEWYVGADFQEKYSDEIVSIVGIAARPATANMEALYQLPWTTEEANNIKAQFESLDAVPNYPGSYYLARYINFAFLAAYNEGKDPADSLYSYVPLINEEITRKRTEFGMEVAKKEED